MGALRVAVSTSAAARLEAARAFMSAIPASAAVLIVGASRGAADDFARSLSATRGASFGLDRFSLMHLAARIAMAGRGPRAPATAAGAEAFAAQAIFEASEEDALAYFRPVAHMPGFPRAVARTIHELRLAQVTPRELLAPRGDGPRPDTSAMADLSRLLSRVEEEFDRADVSDRADLLTRAARLCETGEARWVERPLILLDVPLDSAAERSFARALIRRASQAIALVPSDDPALDALIALASSVDRLPDPAAGDTDLSNLRHFVFSNERPDERARAGDVVLFSAPGEGREAVEIVRCVLDEADRGVPFDEMAVLLRTPEPYVDLLEHACARAQIPAFFDRGTRRPDPSGRAFVALMSCAVEGLSARRFDEYLSLGQVPASLGQALGLRSGQAAEEDGAAPAVEVDSDDEAVVAGTLRSPWKWEELIVESAVVGGRDRADGRRRWRRRLDGLAGDYRFRLEELRREDPDSARLAGLRRDLRNLAHLRAFALPIIDRLAEWPDRATWGAWAELFADLAAAALRRPDRVRRVLNELGPMAAVGPISLEEARDVLHARLTSLDWEPPSRRYGQVFIGTPHQARGRAFRVVFVPGLAERLVPQRPREDPLLLDGDRERLGAALVDQTARSQAERLLLRIAIGAAGERLYLSYPRMDVGETRPRVPSFYALDVMRAITGSVPDHAVLAAEAAETSGARLAWPAPSDPDRAIDDLEHDLASIRPLLDSRDPASVRGRAHYLLGLNGALRRSVIARWSRHRPAWSPADGLVTAEGGAAPALVANRLKARPYSLSALQRFATCPYQFLLATIHRLEPREDPEPLLRLDPLTRGSLFHRVQAEFYRRVKLEGRLPLTTAALTETMQILDAELDRVAREYEEELAPAIPRIWHGEISDLRRDLGIWLRRIAEEHVWQPEYFEFSFGLNDEGRDPRSLPKPVQVGDGFVLRGSVDLLEHRPDIDVWRVTDHKTGKNRTSADLIVGGGQTLQPVLYSVAVEQGLGVRVAAGRLFFCTTVGGFADTEIPITDTTRARGLEVLSIIDRAIEQGFLTAAPAEGACTWCDFRAACGPREEERVKRKRRDRLGDLLALREMP